LKESKKSINQTKRGKKNVNIIHFRYLEAAGSGLAIFARLMDE